MSQFPSNDPWARFQPVAAPQPPADPWARFQSVTPTPTPPDQQGFAPVNPGPTVGENIEDLGIGLIGGPSRAARSFGGGIDLLGRQIPGAIGEAVSSVGRNMVDYYGRVPAPQTAAGQIAGAVTGLPVYAAPAVVAGPAAGALGLGTAGTQAAVAGAGAAGGFLGEGGAGFLGAQERLAGRGIVGPEADATAENTGLAMGAVGMLEALPVLAAARPLLKPVVTRVGSATVGRLMRTEGGQMLVAAAAEGSQEAAITLTEHIMRDLNESDPEAYQGIVSDLAMSAGTGAVLGAGVRGLTGMAAARSPSVQDRAISQASEADLARAYPDLVRQPTPPTPRGGVNEGDAAISEAVRRDFPAEETPGFVAPEQVDPDPAPVEEPAPSRVAKADIIDSIPANQQDKFAIQNAIENEPGEFVERTISLSDLGDIPRENLDAEKVRNFTGMEQADAPPIIATVGPDGKLRIRDGRHRVLAQALRAKQAGTTPSNATIRAVVPENWQPGQAEAAPAESAPPKSKPRMRLDYGGTHPTVYDQPVKIVGKTDTGYVEVQFEGGGRDFVSPDLVKGGGPRLVPVESPTAKPVQPKTVAPAKATTPKGVARVATESDAYVQKSGLPKPPPFEYVKVDTARAKRIADAYEAAKHSPNDPAVKRSYDAFKQETKAQWDHLKESGVKFEAWTKEGQPYKNSAEMIADVEKGHLYFFTGGDSPKDHPLAQKVPGEGDLTYNNMFRAVHDYFGHAKEGVQFGPRGEENAWRVHSAMYGPEARKAMTAETRGQNSWVNYGPKGDFNRNNPAKTIYAEQKAVLLPDEFVNDGAPIAETMPEADRFPEVGELVDGRKVRPEVPNMASIESSLDDYRVMPGIREVRLSEFPAPPARNARTERLAAAIRESGEISPLIVVIDAEGPYILEGGHRYDALKILGAKSFPAKVVFDTTVEPSAPSALASAPVAAKGTTPPAPPTPPAPSTPSTPPTPPTPPAPPTPPTPPSGGPTPPSGPLGVPPIIPGGGKRPGRLDQVAQWFEQNDANRPLPWVTQKDRIRGRRNLAQRDALTRQIEPLEQKAKKAGLDLDDRVTQYAIKQALTDPKKRAASTLPKPILDWIDQSRKEIDAVEAEIVKAARGLNMHAFADSVERRMGTYLPSVWLKHMGKKPTKGGPTKTSRLPSELAHFRQDAFVITGRRNEVLARLDTRADADAEMTRLRASLSPKDAAALELHEPIPESDRFAGELHDPRFLVGKALVEGVHTVEMMKLLAEGRKWIVKPPKGVTGSDLDAWAKTEGVEKLPEDRRLGPLSGQYLPERLSRDLMDFYTVPNQAVKLWQSFLSVWKLGKTAYNPATHARNVLSNAVVFSMLDGSSPVDPRNWGHYQKSMQEIVSRSGDDWRLLAEHNLVGVGGRISGDMQGVFDPAHKDFSEYTRSKTQRMIRRGLAVPRDIYGAEDDLFKLASFKKHVANGMSRADALQAVREFLPDPARASKFARVVRNVPLGSPFITFTDQALRIAGRAAKKRPMQLAGIILLPILLNQMSRSWLAMDESEEKMLSERTWAEPLLPWRDSRGKAETLDLRYIIPLANDVLPEQKGSSVRLPLITTGPLADTIVEQLSGVERFTGRQFIREDMGTGENLAARGKRAASTLNPLPPFLTYGVPSITKAATGESETLLSRAIMQHLAGINVRTPHIAERHVRKLAYGFLDEKDRSQARKLVETWNETYRPGKLKAMDWGDIVDGWRASIRGNRSAAAEKAGRALIAGDKNGASKIIEAYNQNERGDFSELTMQEAERAARLLGRQGVTK